MESCRSPASASDLLFSSFWSSKHLLLSHSSGSSSHRFPPSPYPSASLVSSIDYGHSTLVSPFLPSTTPSYRTEERWVCFGGGKRLRRPRIWKTRQRRGSINKSEKLLESIQSVSNVKEEVYGALDAFVAWELDFPLIPVKKALRTLEAERNWTRIIQVSKWMLGKGQGRTLNTYSLLLKALSEDGRIDEAQELYKKIFSKHLNYTPLSFTLQILNLYKRFEMDEDILDVFADMEELGMKLDREMVKIVSDTYEKLGMADKAERVRLKYPPPAFRWRLIDGKTRKIPMKYSSSTGTFQNEDFEREDTVAGNDDEDDLDEEVYDSFGNEDLQGLDDPADPVGGYDDVHHERQLQK